MECRTQLYFGMLRLAITYVSLLLSGWAWIFKSWSREDFIMTGTTSFNAIIVSRAFLRKRILWLFRLHSRIATGSGGGVTLGVLPKIMGFAIWSIGENVDQYERIWCKEEDERKKNSPKRKMTLALTAHHLVTKMNFDPESWVSYKYNRC